MKIISKAGTLLFNYVFDAYRDGKIEDGSYSDLASKTLEAEQGIFQLLMRVAVYASGIALLIAGVMLVYHARHHEKRGETKNNLVRVVVTIGVIFALVSIVDFILSIAL